MVMRAVSIHCESEEVALLSHGSMRDGQGTK